MSSHVPHQPISVFFAYSHKDEPFREQLVNHLSILKRQGVIAEWYDRKITAGSEWAGEIDAHINSAQVILLLISADFLASDYCYNIELKRAMERHKAGQARVIPVILRPVEWHGALFGELQALPKNAKPVSSWRNRDEAFADVARGIKLAVETLTDRSSPTQFTPAPTPTKTLAREASATLNPKAGQQSEQSDRLSYKPTGHNKIDDQIRRIGLDFIPGSLLAALASYLLYIICPGMPDYLITLLAVSILAAMVIPWYMPLVTRLPKRKRINLLLSMDLIIALISLSTAKVVWSPPASPGAAYLIFDVSENMQDHFQSIGDINKTIINSAQATEEDREVGFMLEGGRISGRSTCNDFTEWVAPAPRPTSIPGIQATIDSLRSVRPTGMETRQEALLHAIGNLVGRTDVQQIILVTSGADKDCPILSRYDLEKIAGEKKVKFQLSIISVGPQSEEDQNIFRNTAEQDQYISVNTIEQVPQAVEQIVTKPIRTYYEPDIKHNP